MYCAQVGPYMEGVEADVRSFEVYGERENLALLNQYFEEYGVPANERGIPIVFIADEYVAGVHIPEELPELLARHADAACPALPTAEVQELPLAVIVGAAFVDSINPCAIAVLLILLGGLLVAGDRRRALAAGLAFTTAIYLAYLLFGLGLFSALRVSGLSLWFSRFVGALAILIGILNIKDYFWYGAGGFVMEIPRSWRPALKGILRSATTPAGAFLAGFAVMLFELPCTGGPYLFVLGLLAERTAQAVPVLLLYNIVFVLPLVLITLLVYYGRTTVERADQWKERNIRLLHLVAGVVMLLLGIVVVAGWM